jgi:predicted nuclease of predicted toxin-antitoxin system
MSLRLMMDGHVPFEITANLRAKGVDVLRAQDDGSETLADVELLEHAMHRGREIVTQDTDFLIEAARRQRAGTPFCGIFFAPQNQNMNRIYAEWLEIYAKLENPEDVAGRVIYIP